MSLLNRKKLILNKERTKYNIEINQPDYDGWFFLLDESTILTDVDESIGILIPNKYILDSYPESNIISAYSIRKLKSDALYAFQIQNERTKKTKDIPFDVWGNVDVNEISSFLRNETGRIIKWYDQLNRSNIFQASAKRAPIWKNNSIQMHKDLDFSIKINRENDVLLYESRIYNYNQNSPTRIADHKTSHLFKNLNRSYLSYPEKFYPKEIFIFQNLTDTDIKQEFINNINTHFNS